MSSEPFRSFPTVPNNLSTSDHEMNNYYHVQETPQPVPNTLQTISPYLGLRARLSQIWINRWTVLLFLILVRILLAIAGLNNDLGSAKTEAMSACSGVESMGSAMASMPHYLAAGVNEMAASGVEKAIYGLMSMLLLVMTGVEELFIFYIHMLTQTYECLLTLVVEGSIQVVIQAIEDASNFLNSTLQGISKDISTTVDSFQTDFNKFIGGLNSIPQAFGGKSGGVPTINVNDSISKLNNIHLPADLQGKLTALNSSMPSFATVENFTDNLFRFPFEEVKTKINNSIHFTFNRSLLPVPDKEQLTFCSDSNGISDFFDDLANVIQLARRLFIAILVLFAIAVCVPMAYLELRRWKTMQQRAKLVRDKSLDPLDVIYIASHPYTASAGIKAASPFRSSKRQALTRWVIAYATSPPALLVLSLGITGLLACLCQYILLRTIQREVPALANQVEGFADKVINSLSNASSTWANGTNNAISGVNNDINTDVLGWVNTTVGAVNGTLNAFIDEATKTMNTTFGGTVLYQPMLGLFNCLIGLKVNSIEQGLTWVSDNAHVDFPVLPGDTFSLGAAASIADKATSTPGGTSPDPGESFLANPGSETTDKISNAVAKVATHIADAIRTEAVISLCILCLWLVVFLLGLGRAVYLYYRPEKVRGEGGPQPRTNRPFSSIIRGPAPAYEPPIPKEAAMARSRPFPSFSEPLGGNNRPRAESEGDSIADLDVFDADEKTGHAGFNSPPARAGYTNRTDELAGRRSVYPCLENEKPDPFRDP